jgi:hypothetical protein
MMKHNHEKCKKSAHILLYLSFVTLVLAAVVSIVQVDLWLAGTQWILVAILLAIYALILGGGNSDSSCCESDTSE